MASDDKREKQEQQPADKAASDKAMDKAEDKVDDRLVEKGYKDLSVEEQRELPNWAHFKQWLDQRVEVYSINYKSYASYEGRARMVHKYLEEVAKKRLVDLTASDILEYKTWMEERDLSKETMRACLMVVRCTLEMFDSYGIKEYTWPTVVRFRRKKEVEEYRIPTPAQIYAIRSKRHVRIRDIALFEMLLSSGMRFREISQVRASDISFEHKVMDTETGQPSKYVGGHLKLTPRKVGIKTQKGRVVYFSTFAAKWLKIYMARLNVEKNPHIPIFGFGYATCANWVRALGKGVLSGLPIGSKLVNGQMDAMLRKPGYEDVNTAELDVPEHFKKMIRSAQQNDKKERSKHELLDKLESVHFNPKKKHVLHMHACRHFYAGVMWHRAWNGMRHDIKLVQKLLGHKQYMETEGYLRKVDFDITEEEWKRICLGRSTDWPNVDTSLKRYGKARCTTQVRDNEYFKAWARRNKRK